MIFPPQKRAYIIGNGITLTPEDLDRIKGWPAYACNRINLMYDKTSWRPTVYVHPESLAPDIPFIQENIDLGIECWIGEHFISHIKASPSTNFIKDCHHHLADFANPDVPDEWHLPQLCSFGGSVNVMMQLAVKRGYNELILLGCDLLYRDNKQSHFDKRYEHGGEQSAFTAARNALFGHIQAMNWIHRKNKSITVLNATRGGLLELWPRVRLEEWSIPPV